MIPDISIRTLRLDLVPATLEHLVYEQTDLRALESLLHAAIPPSWPPAMLTGEVLAEFIRMKKEGSDPNFILWYWILNDACETGRTLIGSGGISSAPGAKNTVVLGYSVLEPFQCRGYATEAVSHMIPVIFSDPSVQRIIATTFPDLHASIRVLEKTGFVCTGRGHASEGMEEGTLWYVNEKLDEP